MSMDTIEQLTKQHAADRALLAERMQAYQDEIELIKRRKLPGIKSAVAAARESHVQLRAAIDVERYLFARPRTRILHGIKVGLQKGKGKLKYASLDSLVEKVREHFPKQFKTLIKTTHKPIAKALLNLPAVDLQKLGAEVKDTGDEVVIAPADSDIDKLVDALLKAKAEEQDQDEAA